MLLIIGAAVVFFHLSWRSWPASGHGLPHRHSQALPVLAPSILKKLTSEEPPLPLNCSLLELGGGEGRPFLTASADDSGLWQVFSRLLPLCREGGRRGEREVPQCWLLWSPIPALYKGIYYHGPHKGTMTWSTGTLAEAVGDGRPVPQSLNTQVKISILTATGRFFGYY